MGVREVIREPIADGLARAVFAGGCFWCLEAAFQALEGVEGAINGYAGGRTPEPTYREVCEQQTDHREAVLVYYAAEKINYSSLLEIFWQSIDPFDAGGQFFDRGQSYTTAVFYLNEQQKRTIEASKARLEKRFERPIATEILPYSTFFEAEAYHQDFYQKAPERYQDYVQASNREEYKRLIWEASQREGDSTAV